MYSKTGEKQVNIRDVHREELKQMKNFKYLGSLKELVKRRDTGKSEC